MVEDCSVDMEGGWEGEREGGGEDVVERARKE